MVSPTMQKASFGVLFLRNCRRSPKFKEQIIITKQYHAYVQLEVIEFGHSSSCVSVKEATTKPHPFNRMKGSNEREPRSNENLITYL